MIINSIVSNLVEVGNGSLRVRFFDFDGTLLKTQWVNSGGNATPPPIPTHEYLTFDEWNQSTSNVVCNMDVGATYYVTDGKSYIKIRVYTSQDVSIIFNKSDASTLTVDWGDTNTTDITASGSTTATHTYAAGTYWISVDITSGSGTYTMSTAGLAQGIKDAFRVIYFGADTNTVPNAAWKACHSLQYVVFPNTITTIASTDYTFGFCCALVAAVIPRSLTTLLYTTFHTSESFRLFSFPDTLVSLAQSAIGEGGALQELILPYGFTTMGPYMMYKYENLRMIEYPESTTSIAMDATYALGGCLSISDFICRATTPPTLSGVPGGYNTQMIIWVPDASLTAYQTATNWVSLASRIKPLSEFSL